MIKRDDVINLEITGSDAAKLYAIMGRTNGPTSSLWSNVKELFEPGDILHKKYSEFFNGEGLTAQEVLRYNNYYREWEDHLFGPLKVKTEAELELEALEGKMKELQDQMERVKLAIAS